MATKKTILRPIVGFLLLRFMDRLGRVSDSNMSQVAVTVTVPEGLRGEDTRMMGSCAKYQRPCAHYILWGGGGTERPRAEAEAQSDAESSRCQGEVVAAVSSTRPSTGSPPVPPFSTFLCPFPLSPATIYAKLSWHLG